MLWLKPECSAASRSLSKIRKSASLPTSIEP